MTRADRAIALHRGGSACSQAVFAVFAQELGLPPAPAHRLAGGFGAGMGRSGSTCGAFSGAVLALSLAFGADTGADQERKSRTYDLVGRFLDEAKARHGSTTCPGLLGLDIKVEADRARFKAEGLSEKICVNVIRDTVETLERQLVAAGMIRPSHPDRTASPAGVPGDSAPVKVAAGDHDSAGMPGLRIARATADDAGTLAFFRYEMFRDMLPDSDWSFRRDMLVAEAARYFREQADSPYQMNYVAFLNGQAVGSACAILQERPPHVRYDGVRYGYVHNVYVKPEARGQGVARALLKRLHAEAAKAGVVRLSLHASRFGRPLYLDLGYESIERYMESDLPRD